jgi:hypothetical protein
MEGTLGSFSPCVRRDICRSQLRRLVFSRPYTLVLQAIDENCGVAVPAVE